MPRSFTAMAARNHGMNTPGRRPRASREPSPYAADDAGKDRIGRLESAGGEETRRLHRHVAAAELDEDGEEDAEGDGQLRRETKRTFHRLVMARAVYGTVFPPAQIGPLHGPRDTRLRAVIESGGRSER